MIVSAYLLIQYPPSIYIGGAQSTYSVK